MSGTETTPIRAADVLRAIANAMDSGLSQPMHVSLNTPATGFTRHGVQIRLADNATDDLAVWAGSLGIGEVSAEGTVFDKRSRAWRSHRAGGEWQGWTVDLWSAVDEPEDVTK
jgi:hypothetical protein